MIAVGMRVRVTNPKAHPRWVVLALSRGFVTVWHRGMKRRVKFPRSRIERVNG